MSPAASASHLPHYVMLGEPGTDIRAVWFCLPDAGQSVEELARQLTPLDTPERLLVLLADLPPAEPEAASQPLGPVALDALATEVLAQCPTGITTTVLGFGLGAAAACRWLARGHTGYSRLVFYAAVFPAAFDRPAVFAALPDQPITIVATTVDTVTPEAAGEGLLQDLRAAGKSATLRHVVPGPVTLAALGAAADGPTTSPA